jgi:tricorn protease
MGPRASLGARLAVVLLAVAAAVAGASPIKLARHPDYRAGRIVFSYLGDIWIASEDGSSARRVTDHVAREVYPRFSPDGRWIAFSSNRYGNNDVFIVPVEGGAPRRLTFHSGNDEVVGWTRDSTAVIFRAAATRTGAPVAAAAGLVAVPRSCSRATAAR